MTALAALLLQLLSDPLSMAALASLPALVLTVLFLRHRKPWTARLRPKPLLTPNEAEFFHRLQRALPHCHVFPQVAFAAIITDDGALSVKARWSLRAKFDRKMADFVICDRQGLKVLALVELDDRTHVAANDRQRDALTKAAGYQTFRFSSKHKPSAQELAALFQHARAWSA